MMVNGTMALRLKRELVWEVGMSSVVVPINCLWPGAVGVVVIFESPEAAKKAMGDTPLREVQWPMEDYASALQKGAGGGVAAGGG